MTGKLGITCYGDRDECAHLRDGFCTLYDRLCGQIHVDEIKEDGEE
jgi:hypothetical protein